MPGLIKTLPDGRHRLELLGDELREFANSIRGLDDSSLMSEVRLDATSAEGEAWVIYWKLKSGDTKLLLAHPETGQWVATCAMTGPVAAILTSRLELLESQSTFSLRDPVLLELAPISRTSNFDLEISRI